MLKVVHVAVAVIFDEQGRVLVARRPDHVHQGGLLEFPGGKVEPGEPLLAAMYREIDEELGLDLTPAAGRPLIVIRHDYPDKQVLLEVWAFQGFRGEPRGREGQPVFALWPAELNAAEFPAANRAIIDAIRLPERCVITDPSSALATEGQLQRAVRRRASMLVLRAPDLALEDYRHWAVSLLERWRQDFELILLHGEAGLALYREQSIPVDGCHLTSRQLITFMAAKEPLAGLFGASCHNEAELRQAQAAGCNYAFLSPVLATSSHPAAKPLGWDGFASLVQTAAIPVYALGGLVEADLAAAQQAYGQGIAGISAWS